MKKEAVYLSLILKEAGDDHYSDEVRSVQRFGPLKVLHHGAIGVWTVHEEGNPDRYDVYYSEEEALEGAKSRKDKWGFYFDGKPFASSYKDKLLEMQRYRKNYRD